MHPLLAHHVCACGRVSLETLCPLCEDRAFQARLAFVRAQKRKTAATMARLRSERLADEAACPAAVDLPPAADEQSPALPPARSAKFGGSPEPSICGADMTPQIEARVRGFLPPVQQPSPVLPVVGVVLEPTEEPVREIERTVEPVAQASPVKRPKRQIVKPSERKPTVAPLAYPGALPVELRSPLPESLAPPPMPRTPKPVVVSAELSEADRRTVVNLERLKRAVSEGKRLYAEVLAFDVWERKDKDGTKLYRPVRRGMNPVEPFSPVLRLLGKRNGDWEEKVLTMSYAGR